MPKTVRCPMELRLRHRAAPRTSPCAPAGPLPPSCPRRTSAAPLLPRPARAPPPRRASAPPRAREARTSASPDPRAAEHARTHTTTHLRRAPRPARVPRAARASASAALLPVPRRAAPRKGDRVFQQNSVNLDFFGGGIFRSAVCSHAPGRSAAQRDRAPRQRSCVLQRMTGAGRRALSGARPRGGDLAARVHANIAGDRMPRWCVGLAAVAEGIASFLWTRSRARERAMSRVACRVRGWAAGRRRSRNARGAGRTPSLKSPQACWTHASRHTRHARAAAPRCDT